MRSPLQKLIRQMLLQEINDMGIRFVHPENLQEYERIFGKPPIKLTDRSRPRLIGDPIKDVDLNQMKTDTGSDGKAATAVGVKAGSPKSEDDFTKGQRKANFVSKKEAPSKVPGAKD